MVRTLYSQAAVNIWANEIQAKSWVTILQHGYMPEFVVLPTLYHEPNNKSFGHSTEQISGVGAGPGGVCGTSAGTCPLLQPVRSGCEI